MHIIIIIIIIIRILTTNYLKKSYDIFIEFLIQKKCLITTNANVGRFDFKHKCTYFILVKKIAIKHSKHFVFRVICGPTTIHCKKQLNNNDIKYII